MCPRWPIVLVLTIFIYCLFSFGPSCVLLSIRWKKKTEPSHMSWERKCKAIHRDVCFLQCVHHLIIRRGHLTWCLLYVFILIWINLLRAQLQTWRSRKTKKKLNHYSCKIARAHSLNTLFWGPIFLTHCVIVGY